MIIINTLHFTSSAQANLGGSPAGSPRAGRRLEAAAAAEVGKDKPWSLTVERGEEWRQLSQYA